MARATVYVRLATERDLGVGFRNSVEFDSGSQRRLLGPSFWPQRLRLSRVATGVATRAASTDT